MLLWFVTLAPERSKFKWELPSVLPSPSASEFV